MQQPPLQLCLIWRLLWMTTISFKKPLIPILRTLSTILILNCGTSLLATQPTLLVWICLNSLTWPVSVKIRASAFNSYMILVISWSVTDTTMHWVRLTWCKRSFRASSWCFLINLCTLFFHKLLHSMSRSDSTWCFTSSASLLSSQNTVFHSHKSSVISLLIFIEKTTTQWPWHSLILSSPLASVSSLSLLHMISFSHHSYISSALSAGVAKLTLEKMLISHDQPFLRLSTSYVY